MILSILIPTLAPDASGNMASGLAPRAHLLQRLLAAIEPQKTPEVEIIVCADNGRRSIGDKRNELLKKSSGKYVCFFDDDDLPSDDYIPQILAAIKDNPGVDCVGFKVARYSGGWPTGVAEHSLRYSRYGTRNEGASVVYERTPNHLNPVRRSIAAKAGFAHKSFGEDSAYAEAIRPMLKSEAFIDKVLYHYYFDDRKAQATNVYSVGGEQPIIADYFYNVCGRFLDIGAYDGERDSNTRHLAMQNWSGVLVEPAFSIVESLRCLYRGNERIAVEQACICGTDGPDSISFFDACGEPVSTAVPGHADLWRNKVSFTPLQVPRLSMAALLDRHGYEFDFISIDAEGMNWEIFRAIPWSKLTRLRMLCIEHTDNIDGSPVNVANDIKEIAASWKLKDELLRNSENIILAKPR